MGPKMQCAHLSLEIILYSACAVQLFLITECFNMARAATLFDIGGSGELHHTT